MLQRIHRSFFVRVWALAGAAAVALPFWSPPGAQVRTADQNGDGWPDIWRSYDRHGQLSRVAVDTNFDGRSDVQEYYERGALVRRESDRDFNDRVDLIQEFDPATHNQVRAEVDVDFDGTADLLVLFRGGQPVVWKYGRPVAAAVAIVFSGLEERTAHRSANDQLGPLLEDPFGIALSVRASHVGLLDDGDSIGLSASGGFPASRCDVTYAGASSAMPGTHVSYPVSTTLVLHSPRGPPPSSPLG